MNGKLYWKNKLPFILTNLFCMILMTLFLLACGNAVAVVEMILIVWVLILMAGMGIAYRNRKKKSLQPDCRMPFYDCRMDRRRFFP